MNFIQKICMSVSIDIFIFLMYCFPRLSGLLRGWLQRTFQEKGKNLRLFGYLWASLIQKMNDQLFINCDETGSILSL